MKTLIFNLIAASLLVFAFSTFAASVIVTDTTGWQSVPIRVDSANKTYIVEGTAPTSGSYYYTYPGYRCVTVKRDIAGVNVLTFSAGVSGGSEIYCYPE